VIPKIFSYFDQAIEMGASDLNIKPGAPPIFRVNGHLVIAEDEPFATQEMFDLFLPLIDAAQQAVFKETFEVFSALSYEGKVRIRFYLFQQREGMAGSFRLIPTKVPTIRELGLPDKLEQIAEKPWGLFLVTGPAGAGKSHTMAAMVNHINMTSADHIITMENPIEFVYSPEKSIFTQIHVGVMIPTFQDALSNALRQDPDVMLVGEMVDPKTVEMALVAAETGHFVMSTLPTIGAAPTIERITSFFPVEKHDEIRLRVSLNLVGIFSQILIPKSSMNLPASVAYEMMIPNPAIRNHIRERKYSQLQSTMMMARKEGCVTMKDSLNMLLKDEETNHEIVKARLQEIIE
jgi:twitching motility protein PilT